MNKIENVHIKRANLKDLDQLQKVSRQTFSEAFSAENTEENMKKYLDEGFSTNRLTTELNDPNSEFYFAELGGAVIGYIKLNRGKSQTDLKDDDALEIERIYVLKEYYGRKVGQLLYEKALQVAKASNAAYIWLGVWEENKKAISFYRKNGFVAFDKHIFMLGDDEQTDIMMKLEL